jgi:hypothetical protein
MLACLESHPGRAQTRSCSVPHFKFCDNCDTSVTIVVPKNGVCRIRYWITNGAIFGQNVVVRPKGIYGSANSTQGAYRAPIGVTGEDSFVVEIRYERGGTKFSTRLLATVRIVE